MEIARAVDCHAHVFSRDAPPITGARYRPAYEARLESWRALWTTAGVTRGVLVQPSFFGCDNAELLAALATDREGLRGVAVVDPASGADALARLADAGVRAVRLNLAGTADLQGHASEPWRAFFRRVDASGLHVEVFVDPGRLPDIAPALADARVRVVFDHFGNPGHDDAAIDATFVAVARLARGHRVGCKLSGRYRIGAPDARGLALRWLEIVGPENLVWGSDWPWTRHEQGRDYGALRRELEAWAEPGLARRILWDNAAALYRFA